MRNKEERTIGRKVTTKISGFSEMRTAHIHSPVPFFFMLLLLLSSLLAGPVSAGELKLQDLIDEAMKSNPEILSASANLSASKYRIPQVKSLPDPMFMFGYKNEGFKRYTYGDSPDAKWMYTLSETFPFPGKLPLKGEIASKESESIEASYKDVKLRIIERIKALYYELFLAFKNIDLLDEKSALFSQVENAAIARYSTGKGSQQEVLMAQTEKYLILEKKEMYQQTIQSLQAMLNAAVGRQAGSPLERPSEPQTSGITYGMEQLMLLAFEKSPGIQSKWKLVTSAEKKVLLAKKQYYPDFTVSVGYEERKNFEDMWSLTTAINIPLFYKTKQRQGVLEAEANLSGAKNELESIKLMISSAIRDNYSMLVTAEKLMELYKSGLIPKSYQDFDLALSGYKTGSVDALTAITRLKSIIDLESSYWGQFIEREKAIARLEAITGIAVKNEQQGNNLFNGETVASQRF
jgi:cobalt-zinc-cadmium efflux system outer membrane protein